MAEHVISSGASLAHSFNLIRFSACQYVLITMNNMVMGFEWRPAFFTCVCSSRIVSSHVQIGKRPCTCFEPG